MKYGSGSFTGETKTITQEIHELANPEKVAILQRFFKTGPGEYGEGDKFLGLVVPQCRKISKSYYQKISDQDLTTLLHSEWHEERQIALFIMVLQYKKADENGKRKLYEMFLQNTKYINNWDLVDCNTPHIVGGYIYHHSDQLPVLDKLSSSDLLWDKRIAVLATFYFIAKGDPTVTLKIVDKLLEEDHDLLHKANGWMLREIGKKIDAKILLDYIKENYDRMPRTTLRYAIELFNPDLRKRILAGQF